MAAAARLQILLTLLAIFLLGIPAGRALQRAYRR